MTRNIIKELEELRAKHKKSGRSKAPRVRANFPDLKAGQSQTALSNTITTGGFKRDKTTEHRWKRGCEEKPETIKAIEEKAKRVAIQSNKAGYSYITPGTDPKDFGRK